MRIPTTLLPEELEKWPVAWFEWMLPRHLEIIYKINWGLLSDVRKRFSNTTLVTSGEGLSESENYGIILFSAAFLLKPPTVLSLTHLQQCISTRSA